MIEDELTEQIIGAMKSRLSPTINQPRARKRLGVSSCFISVPPW